MKIKKLDSSSGEVGKAFAMLNRKERYVSTTTNGEESADPTFLEQEEPNQTDSQESQESVQGDGVDAKAILPVIKQEPDTGGASLLEVTAHMIKDLRRIRNHILLQEQKKNDDKIEIDLVTPPGSPQTD